MKLNHGRLLILAIAGSGLCAACFVQRSAAYVEAPMSLGAVVSQSTHIMLMRVVSVDREKNLIIYRKERDIKGKHPQDLIKHNIGRGGLRPNEWKPQMDWAEPGKAAIFFHNGGASETCCGTWWYQAYGGGEWWNHSHAEPFLLRSFAGQPEKLAGIVAEMVAGRETVAPCMINGNLEDLHNRRAKIQRLRVSLKLLDYNPKRDFVGWGGEDFRRLNGMAGFTHFSALGRVDPEAQAISCADIDGDGKMDLCLVGGGKVTLLMNGGESLNEAGLPITGGARSAVWADYNGDGKPDLLLATPSGPKLLTNLGGSFRDDSAMLPLEKTYTLTAAVWIDHDGDGVPDILLANGYHGLRLYRNRTGNPAPGRKPFEDVSTEVGLGVDGVGAGMKGDTLTVCDVNGDGRPDFLYGGGDGILVLNNKGTFAEARDSGIAYKTGKASPVFRDFDGDGVPDLFVPLKDGCKLFKNDGKGRFSDVTAKAGALATFTGWATSAAHGDFDNDGKPDLIVGCLRGPNRFFRNKGDGAFEDATTSIGLEQKIFNSQAVCLVDLNNDGALDLVLNNEGQESAVLLGAPPADGKRQPVTITVAGKGGATGSKVQIMDKQGKLRGVQEISGGDGRGGQQAPLARFAFEPGSYRLMVRYSSGVTRAQEITVASSPVRVRVDEKTPLVD
ncbi:MAG: VCBS repeat-containing protein [Planctomycetes bacterium]|nr:VCBS repeat-containing protein [Planctomycetota bacterium]